jgi:hypothetical protein
MQSYADGGPQYELGLLTGENSSAYKIPTKGRYVGVNVPSGAFIHQRKGDQT